jgi:hypothetical protein
MRCIKRPRGKVCTSFSTAIHLLKISTPLGLALLSACGGGGGSNQPPLSGNNATTPTPTSPPASGSGVLSISLNQTGSISYGAPANLGIDATNVSGTASFSLIAAPDGMSIDPGTGAITYTPAGLRFGTNTTTLFTVSVSDDDETISETFSITVEDDAVNQPLVRSSVKGPSKAKSIHIGDFDGIAGNEILTTDNRSLVYTLKWDATLTTGIAAPTGDLYQEWVYPFSLGNQAHIDAIDAEDVDLDGRLDILVLNGNTVSVIDGASRALSHSYQIAGAETGYALSAADIDNDGVVEIVALVSVGTDSEQLHVLALPNPVGSSDQLVLEWASSSANYGKDMVIAAADFADLQLEIITANAYVIDGISYTDEWTLAKPANGFGDEIIAADLVGDNIVEIIALRSSSGVIEVYSPQHQSDLFGQLDPLTDPETTRCGLASVDLDSDGSAEILAPGCINGGGTPDTGGSEYINLLTADSQASFTSHFWLRSDTPANFWDDRVHGGFVGLAVGDVNNDGNPDAIWANRFSDGHYDSFTILQLDTDNDPDNFSTDASLVAQSITYGLFDTAFTGAINFDFDGATDYATFMSIARPAEINAGGDPEFELGSRAAFIDYTTGRVQISRGLTATNATFTGNRVMAADLTGKGYDQLIFSSGTVDANNNDVTALQISDFNGTVQANGLHSGWEPLSTIPVEYFAGLVADNLPASFDLADTGGDVYPELIGFVGNYLFYYDFIAGTDTSPIGDRQWQSIRVEGNGIDIKFADLDNDTVMDVVHLTDSNLYLRKRDSDAQHAGSPFYDTVYLFNNSFQGNAFKALQILDVDGDNQMEIVVSDTGTDDEGITSTTIYLLDNTATELAQLTIDGEITDFQLGPNGSTLLAAWKTGGGTDSIASSYISELAFSADMSSIVEVLRSPALLGAVSPNSMNYGPANQLLIGTEYGMYISQ